MAKQRQRTRRQHTVPRNLLQRFLESGRNTLFVFDKQTQKVHEGTIANVSVENGFYDLPDEVFKKYPPKEGDDIQFLEHGLAKAEAQFKSDLDEFLANVETKGITPIFRAMLAPYLIIQHLRGRESREADLQQKEKVHYALFRAWCKKHHPDVPIDDVDVEVKYDRKLLVIDQTLHLMNYDMIEKIAADLLEHIWVVGINTTIQPFYTSDNPIVKKAHITIPGRSFTGFRSKGIEIAFPFSSSRILLMYERSYHARATGRLENGVHYMNPFGVEHYNQMQVKQCYRHVICGKDEFDQAKGVCRRFPEVCDPNRSRCRVEVNGDIIGALFH